MRHHRPAVFRRRSVVLSLGVVAFLTTAARVSAMPTIAMVSPANNAPVPDSVPVSAKITSAFVITSVTGKIGTVSMPLTAAGSTYGATLDISALAYGPQTLTITATDANNETATVTETLAHDAPPKLVVVTPPFSVANPTLRVQASCTATAPYACASVTLAVGATTLKTANGASLDYTADFTGQEGQTVTFTLTALDTAGMSASIALPAFVEYDGHLVLIDSVASRILDVDATRILYADATGVHVKTRANGVITDVGAGNDTTETFGHLSSAGAAWTNGDWINGTTTPRPTALFTARGDWGLRMPAVMFGAPQREDLSTGALEALTTAHELYDLGDVDSNGTVAYTRYDPGTNAYDIATVLVGGNEQVAVGKNTGGLLYPNWPVIDGANLVWSQHVTGSGPRQPIALTNAGGTTLLDSTFGAGAGSVRAQPGIDYRANDGWVAFDKEQAGHLSAWTRAPDGTTALACPLADAAAISALNSNGEIAVDVAGARYLCEAVDGGASSALPIGGSEGTMHFINDDWYETVGRNLYKVSRTVVDAGADAGSSDGGTTSDAGGSPVDGSITPDSGGGAGTDGSTGVDSDSGATGGGDGGDSGGCNSAGEGIAGPMGVGLPMLGLLLLGTRRRRHSRTK